MKSIPVLVALAASTVVLAARAQVGTHGEAGGMPYGPQRSMIGTDANARPARPKWATSNPWSTAYNPLIGFQSTKTREQVRAELAAGDQARLAAEGLAGRRG